MIKSLHIRPEKHDYYSYLSKTLLKDKKEIDIEFKPGINILLGENGAGKSTVLKYLAALTGCLKAGRWAKASCIATGRPENPELKSTSSVVCDTPKENLRYFDPLSSPGLFGGSFDYDVPMNISLQTLWGKQQNHGHITMTRLSQLLGDVKKDQEDYTLLFDEPDDGLSPGRAFSFWKAFIGNYKCQIIASSQNLACLGFPSVNYIELSPDWILEAKAILSLLNKRPI